MTEGNRETTDGGATFQASPRFVFWGLLLVSWIVLLPFLWQAFAEVPSPERLAQRRTVAIPTLATLGWTVARSLLELVVVLALAWPRGRAYAARLWLAALGTAAWIVMSAPLGITTLEWVHRRWLAGIAAALLLAALAATVSALVRTASGRRTSRP